MKACYSRYHLQSRWSEMTTFIMRCHLQRWRLGKQGIISAKVVSEMTAYSIKYHLQRWQSDFQGIISRDEGLPLTVSSLESLDKHDYVYYKVSSPEITAGKTRYHLYYIESFQGQRWLRILWGIISRDNGWENEVSSLLHRIILG